MKKFLCSLAAILLIGICTSCTDIYAGATTDDIYGEYEVSSSDVTLIITYGTPYYHDGHLWYYYYNNLYYYPFYYNGYIYLRPYTRLYPWGYDFGRFRPNRYDYRYRPPRHHHNPPAGHRPGNRHPGYNHDRPYSGGHNRHSGMGNQPPRRPNGNSGNGSMNRGNRPRPNGNSGMSGQQRRYSGQGGSSRPPMTGRPSSSSRGGGARRH